MSFWSGMARGFKDAEAQRNVKDAAKEREDARLKAEAWQNKTFEYGAKRDDILDKRAEDMTRVEQERYKAEQATAEADKVYTRTTAASQVARDECKPKRMLTVSLNSLLLSLTLVRRGTPKRAYVLTGQRLGLLLKTSMLKNVTLLVTR